MKAIISTTYDSKYLFFLPITTFLWNKLRVDVVCFLPQMAKTEKERQKYLLSVNTIPRNGVNLRTYMFDCPEHKEATYAQCSRLYGACLDLPEDEVLVSSDIDMGLFQVPPYIDGFTIFGSDLTPSNQYPICYISAKVKDWRNAFGLHNKTYQQALDELLAHEECEHFRGNMWGRDQETSYNKISQNQSLHLVKRAREGTQFASKRYDRDDSFILDKLSLDTIDYHMNRPGFEPQNFDIIMKVLEYHYPYENFDWLVNYNEEYKKLL